MPPFKNRKRTLANLIRFFKLLVVKTTIRQPSQLPILTPRLTAGRPYFNERVQLLDFKDFEPNDRDNLIKTLENQEIETMQRRESNFYNYDEQYDYYGG